MRADRRKLALLTLLVALFFAGGMLSAAVFHRLGFLLMLPLAALLAAPTVLPIAADFKRMEKVRI